MTGDEFRAAVERVREVRRRRKAGEGFDRIDRDVYGPALEGRVASPTGDEKAVLDAYLAEHRADDGEQVTGEWLRGEGWEEWTYLNATAFYPPPGYRPPFVCVVFTGRQAALRTAGYPLDVPPTRGSVRRLLAAFGVPPPPQDTGAAR